MRFNNYETTRVLQTIELKEKNTLILKLDKAFKTL